MTFQAGKRTSSPITGLLIANTGTPSAPTPRALRRYLKEFLSDPKVVRLPRWLWLPVMHGIVLTIRPARSARLYARIWTKEGSPLLTTAQAQAAAIAELLADRFESPPKVAIGMRYGEPSVAAGLTDLRKQGVERFLILPLFPQFSVPTSESILEAAFSEIKRWGGSYLIKTIPQYHDHPAYIQSLSNSIREYWRQNGETERLLFSYHGIPLNYIQGGDPYQGQCNRTSSLLASTLGLDSYRWQTAYQSRFGPQAWLQPYTDKILRQWASEGVKRVDVVCPGFAADCLETLHEVDQEMRALFESTGGQEFNYIPALNVRPDHIHALVEIISACIEGRRPNGEYLGSSLNHRQTLTSEEIFQEMHRYR